MIQISICVTQQEDVDKQLLETYAQLQSLKTSFEEIHKAYKNFVFDIVRKIYDQSVRASFEITLKEYSKKNHPIGVQMDITGDSGEGVSEVKKVIMDYLLFSFNNCVDVFVHDSSCYNGVDPRQVRGLLQELDRLCKLNKKQVIVSINKYQVGDSELLNTIIDNACITLSENQKLLKFNF